MTFHFMALSGIAAERSTQMIVNMQLSIAESVLGLMFFLLLIAGRVFRRSIGLSLALAIFS